MSLVLNTTPDKDLGRLGFQDRGQMVNEPDGRPNASLGDILLKKTRTNHRTSVDCRMCVAEAVDLRYCNTRAAGCSNTLGLQRKVADSLYHRRTTAKRKSWLALCTESCHPSSTHT